MLKCTERAAPAAACRPVQQAVSASAGLRGPPPPFDIRVPPGLGPPMGPPPLRGRWVCLYLVSGICIWLLIKQHVLDAAL